MPFAGWGILHQHQHHNQIESTSTYIYGEYTMTQDQISMQRTTAYNCVTIALAIEDPAG